tara:strand:- start:299 stop:508 length:210 start_codon:yes stop_codon:yes gene_type:complete
MPNYRVVLAYDVQRTFHVEAKNKDEAYDKALDWEGLEEYRDCWDYDDHIETVNIDEEIIDNEKQICSQS